ncbi:glutathione peroxidase [Candidatus Laterigemmans baculatus]|uniref:glutathione peroxidase n=1 Tax=Candidatus Laterigemmans baculatus TaxID=2770505 RepID=UPI0013DBC042|nr:glutathione peroxidase [Candidatus Laterigemmans baculatus]
MKLFALLAAGAIALTASTLQAADSQQPAHALDFQAKTIEGESVDLEKYKGQVVLIVNVASKCGLTPQYEGLQAIYEKYQDKGFVVLGFPCNQFKGQEPGTDAEIKQFCTTKYDVSFPLFSKLEVNGEGAAPLYKYLTSRNTEPVGSGEISWNFEKFVIGRDGQVAARFSPRTKPEAPEVIKAIEAEL